MCHGKPQNKGSKKSENEKKKKKGKKAIYVFISVSIRNWRKISTIIKRHHGIILQVEKKDYR